MNSGLAKKKAHNRGTRKGMRRKTARKAYMKVHKSRKSRKPKKSTRKGMRRKTARRAYMNKRGGRHAPPLVELSNLGKQVIANIQTQTGA